MKASDLDDLAPVIGYRATRIIAAWFAGRRLWVPSRAAPGHPLAALMGLPALTAMVREFPGERLWVPTVHEDRRHHRDRAIAEQFASGWTADRVAGEHGVTVRRAEQIRCELVESGLLNYAQGFDTAMAQGKRRGTATAAPEILGTGEVSG